VHVALALKALQTPAIIVCNTRRTRAQLRRGDVRCAGTLRQVLRFLLLQFVRYALDPERLQDILGRGREESENGKRAVFLILFKAATETAVAASAEASFKKLQRSVLLLGYTVTAHPLAGLCEPRQDVLRGHIADTKHAKANGEVRAVAPEPAARGTDHGRRGFVAADGHVAGILAVN